MHRSFFILIVAIFSFCLGPSIEAQNGEYILHVATDGNDSWSGQLSRPDGAMSDGPLATITGARDRIRELKDSGKFNQPVLVVIQGGNYFVDAPLEFGAVDSGTAGTPIVYEAADGNKPIVHGGRLITSWTQQGEFWFADLPDVSAGKWDFSSFWVNGERCIPARSPNTRHPAGDFPGVEELFYTTGPVKEDNNESSKNKFQYKPGDLSHWNNLDEAVVVVFHSWETSFHRIEDLDEANHVVEFTGDSIWPFCQWSGNQRYYVERIFEALDQPGEWYLNHATGRLYYMPRDGEDMTRAEAVAAGTRQLMVVDGGDSRTPVQHLIFRGLGFHYTDEIIPAEGIAIAQASYSLPASVEFSHAVDCVFERCEIAHTGNYGFGLRAGSRNNLVYHNELFDLGAGGVRAGEGDPKYDKDITGSNTIGNNYIHDGGRLFRSGVGVWIARSSGNLVSNNEICDFRYTGVSVGWSWGYAASSAHHNIIRRNHIHDIGRGQLSDLGGIYTLGKSPGTVLENNLIHDILSYPGLSGGWGLYTDEGSSDILIENNIVYNTRTGSFHQHYGRNNVVRNNVLAFSHGDQLVRSRNENHNSFTFERNIVYFNNGLLLGGAWQDGNYKLDYNCYWDTSDIIMDFNANTFPQWQDKGNDEHSIVADPLFADTEHLDITLSPSSPVLSLGFTPIDQSRIGLYGEDDWIGKPRLVARDPFTPPVLPAPAVIAENFDGLLPGNAAPLAVTLGEEGDASIRVSADTAVSGSNSLKFADAPGLEYQFNPHMFYLPGMRTGTVVGSYSIRLGPGADFFVEWRDNSSPYHVGPSMIFNGQGELIAGEKKIADLPMGQWVRVKVSCPLGREADDHYDLSLTPPGEEPRVFENLPCGDAVFNRLDWYGFVAVGDAGTVVYIDDVELHAEGENVGLPVK